ncbi:conserved hypothetical protein, partial [Streptococcus agalactiae COH1]
MIIIVSSVINLFTGSESSNTSKKNKTNPSGATSAKVVKHKKTDEERAEDYIKTLGLNPSDYIKENGLFKGLILGGIYHQYQVI